jgi:hypothetical protein
MYVCANGPCTNRSESQAGLKEAAERQPARATIWRGHGTAAVQSSCSSIAQFVTQPAWFPTSIAPVRFQRGRHRMACVPLARGVLQSYGSFRTETRVSLALARPRINRGGLPRGGGAGDLGLDDLGCATLFLYPRCLHTGPVSCIQRALLAMRAAPAGSSCPASPQV